jgi:hypothetical protein
MRLGLRCLLMVSLAFGSADVAAAQTPVHKPAPWKQFCQPNDGFCFKYPASWTMLGEIFGGQGVVVAPAQKEDRALWDEITLAMVVPAPEGDEEGPGLNGIVEQAMISMREAGQNFVTLQRQERTVDHKPAQMLKAQYHEKATDRDWIEEVVFIEGPDHEVYSVALKCAPQNVARLDPVLKGVLESWTLPEPQPPPDVNEDETPAQSKAPAKAAPEHN